MEHTLKHLHITLGHTIEEPFDPFSLLHSLRDLKSLESFTFFNHAVDLTMDTSAISALLSVPAVKVEIPGLSLRAPEPGTTCKWSELKLTHGPIQVSTEILPYGCC